VELNIAESGVLPMNAAQLADGPGEMEAVLALPLGYPQTNGTELLRARIAACYPGAAAGNVLVTCGGAEANFLAVWAAVAPGDEVVVMQPNYGQIAPLAASFGATVKPWWLREELGWQPDPGELAALVTSRTRLIAVCNPNNPTGAVLSEEAMAAVCAGAARSGAWILADEVYRGAELSGELTATFWGRHERVLATAGLSKAYGLPGLRIGWIIAPEDRALRLWGYKDYTTIGPTVIGDRLAALALEPTRRQEILARTRRILNANYPVVADWIRRRPEFRHRPPAAGAIAWMACPGSGELAERLLREKSVLVCPGEQFEMPGFLRLGYGGHTGELIEALGRVETVIGSLR
jgi:aspartate/methionine/tyrosine aminotransferase